MMMTMMRTSMTSPTNRSTCEEAASEGAAIRTAQKYRIHRSVRRAASRGHGRHRDLTDIGARMKNKRLEIKPPAPIPAFLEKMLASQLATNPGR